MVRYKLSRDAKFLYKDLKKFREIHPSRFDYYLDIINVEPGNSAATNVAVFAENGEIITCQVLSDMIEIANKEELFDGRFNYQKDGRFDSDKLSHENI